MIRPIRVYPDPVLRVRCPDVARFDDELARLVADMVETMHAAPGVGLAAPQVGVEQRVAVVDLSVGRDTGSVLVLVNPVIESAEGAEVDVEGCLSIPDFTEKVARPESLTVSAADTGGERRTFTAEGYLARAICHEIDHLDGVLFVDHLRGLKRERARRFLKRLVKEQDERAEGKAGASEREGGTATGAEEEQWASESSAPR